MKRLYGRLELKTKEQEGLIDKSHSGMGFHLECDDGKSYTVRFMASNPLQVVAIEPSSCAATEVVFTDSWQTERDYRATTRIMKAWWPGLSRVTTKDIMTAPPSESPWSGPTDE